VIGSRLKISIDRIDWKIFKEDYKQLIIIIKKKKTHSLPLRMLIQATLGIIWKTLGLVSKLSTNSQLGSNKLNETKSFQLNFESFRNPE